MTVKNPTHFSGGSMSNKVLLCFAVVSAIGGLFGVSGANESFAIYLTGWALMRDRHNLGV